MMLVNHLELRQLGTQARIWYTTADPTYDRTGGQDNVGTGRGGDSQQPAQGERKGKAKDYSYVLNRIAAVMDDVEGLSEPVGLGALDTTCSYCSKRGHTDEVCFKRVSNAVAKLQQQMNKLAPVSAIAVEAEDLPVEDRKDFC